MAETLFDARVELDVPGETGRQARVFAIWLLCLLAAVIASAYQRDHRPMIVALLALTLPALLTLALNRRYRRGGGHPRGIVVDVTRDGELRLWGRGYGQRLLLDGATSSERLVEVYAGRLGVWRQRRMTVRARRALPGSPGVLELATVAEPSDDAAGLPVQGAEGDCVEIARADYLALKELIASKAG